MKLGQRQSGAASLVLGPCNALPANMRQVIEVSSVHTDERHRRKGAASRLLAEVCDEADQEGVILLLVPEGDQWLQNWYRSHRFVTLQPDPMIMVRPPYLRPQPRAWK